MKSTATTYVLFTAALRDAWSLPEEMMVPLHLHLGFIRKGASKGYSKSGRGNY